MNDQSRLIATISYITLVGWIIALILRQNENPKSELSLFHMRQAFGVMILTFLASTINLILTPISLGFIANLVGFVVFICWLIGLIGALKSRFIKIPFIGVWMQENFRFIG